MAASPRRLRAVPRPPASQGQATFPTDPRELIKALVATHPQYDAFIPMWNRCLDCYEGQNLGAYVFQHLRESAESAKRRRERLYYLNYSQPVVDLYTHYIFAKPAVRKESPEEVLEAPSFEGEVLDVEALAGGEGELGGLPSNPELTEWRKWLRNVDRSGDSIDRFMADSERYALIFGYVLILVDMPQATGPVLTESDREQQQLQPYLTSYFPTEAINWALDDNNKLLWIRFREKLPDNPDPFAPPKPKTTTGPRGPVLTAQRSSTTTARDGIYVTWTRNSWFRHQIKDQKVELVGSGFHGLGEVPVVPLYNKHHSTYPFFGTSLLGDISRINIAIMNWSSLIDEEIYQKTLSILVMAASKEDRAEVVIGSNNVLQWDGQGTPPFFLAPPTDPGAFIASQIERLRDEIYRLAKLGGGLGLTVPQRVPSGVAQAFEFNETNRTLAERADECELAENQIHRLWHLWLGMQWMGTVDYPDDFSVESFMDELDIITKAKQTVRSPTFKRELEKRLVRKMMHNVSPALLQIFGLEIDLLPELVITGFGPLYFSPGETPQATPATPQDISRSPLEAGPGEPGGPGSPHSAG